MSSIIIVQYTEAAMWILKKLISLELCSVEKNHLAADLNQNLTTNKSPQNYK
jgi:hypothetical protein